MTETEPRTPARAGRKRNPALDATILDATLTVLAEEGYDRMTIDLVAARAGTARATVYRRWASKADLVLEAAGRMSAADANLAELPDTGSLRSDMVATIQPFDDEQQLVRMQAIAALLTLGNADPRLAAAARRAGIGPWIEVNRQLIERAVQRGEFGPPGDLDTLSGVIPQLCIARAVQREPITPEFSLALIDGVILPALRGGTTNDRSSR